jgi:hypothetical protein
MARMNTDFSDEKIVLVVVPWRGELQRQRLVLEKIKADNAGKRARLKAPMKRRAWFTASNS